MPKRIRKTIGMLVVSAALGFTGLSATAQAIPPSSPCEAEVRYWCAYYWQDYYLVMGYDYCVLIETRHRCEEDV